MTIISQTGVSTPFVFAATGDELRIAGIISNQIDTSLAVILSNEAGNTVTNAGLIASFGTGDAVTMVGGGTLTNSGGISGGVSATATLTFTTLSDNRPLGLMSGPNPTPGRPEHCVP